MKNKRKSGVKSPKGMIYNVSTKSDEAIEFIRYHEPPGGYFLGFSGGKDSTVLYDLTVKSGVKFYAYYSATGIDPPELCRFIQNNYPDVKWLRPNYNGCRSFFGMIKKRGFPTMTTRWCCNELKKRQTLKIPLQHRLFGIRAEESYKRRNRGRTNLNFEYKLAYYNPIFDWLEWEVWEYINDNKLSYCSLYDEGFSRIGCVVCPFLCSKNMKQINMHRERWPKYYIAFEKAMKELYYSKEKRRQDRLGHSKTFDEFINNWYSAKSWKGDAKQNDGFNL